MTQNSEIRRRRLEPLRDLTRDDLNALLGATDDDADFTRIPELARELASLDGRLGEYERMAQTANAYLNVGADSARAAAEAFALRACALRHLGRSSEALADLESANEYDPSHPRIYFELACLVVGSELERAMRAVERAVVLGIPTADVLLTPELEPLWSHPSFVALHNQCRAQRALTLEDVPDEGRDRDGGVLPEWRDYAAAVELAARGDLHEAMERALRVNHALAPPSELLRARSLMAQALLSRQLSTDEHDAAMDASARFELEQLREHPALTARRGARDAANEALAGQALDAMGVAAEERAGGALLTLVSKLA